MANGHRTQIKRERNAQKDTRPSAKLSYARIPTQKACFVMDAIRGKDVNTAIGILTYNNTYRYIFCSSITNISIIIKVNKPIIYTNFTFFNNSVILIKFYIYHILVIIFRTKKT